jgi:Ni/Fe-hydrogenase 1 B-type cytochrome subunit
MNAEQAKQEPAVRIYVWQLPVRVIHWLIFLAIIVLSATGYYIGNPMSSQPGAARDHFFTGTVRVVHLYAGYVFIASVLARMIWMFTGNAYARWNQFIPASKERIHNFVGTFLFYTFIRRDPPPVRGHNAVAGASYVVVYGLMFLISLTGLALHASAADVGSPLRWFGALVPLFGGLQVARWIHHIIMWLLLGFTVHHVYSALLMSVVEKTGTMESIFSGYKFVPKGEHGES